jgi:tetratricopeptide (TPR) repeat protein
MITNVEKRKLSDKIKQLFNQNKLAEVRKLILKLMKNNPDDHWLLARLSDTYFEERNYSKALEYIDKALNIAPRCPLVLWDYAETLDMLERNKEAMQIYKKLIRRGVNNIAYSECGEGIRWSRSIINDCYYRIGLIYGDISKWKLASKYIKLHIANRNRNCPSIYNLRNVKKEFVFILENKHPRIS